MSGDFNLTLDELREVSRYAVGPAVRALSLIRKDTPVFFIARDAIVAASAFVEGGRRTHALRLHAVGAHRSAKSASTLVERHVAMSAGDAAASAYLHPIARAAQVGHILRSTVHAVLAFDRAGKVGQARDLMDQAVQQAEPGLLRILAHYPVLAGPGPKNEVNEMMGVLEVRLRQRIDAEPIDADLSCDGRGNLS